MEKSKIERVVTTKVTHTDEKSTVEHGDLKAEAEHHSKFTQEGVEKKGHMASWEITSNGDKLKKHTASIDGVKAELEYMYKEGQKRLNK